MDNGFFDRIFSAATGAWATFCMVAVYVFRSWPNIMARNNERNRDRLAEEAGDWERIRSERDVAREERDMVRDRWAACEAERIEWMERAVKAEAILQGFGEWRQMQTVKEATKRLGEDDKQGNSK